MVATKKNSESEDSNSRNGLDPAALQYLVANQKGLVNDPATQVRAMFVTHEVTSRAATALMAMICVDRCFSPPHPLSPLFFS